MGERRLVGAVIVSMGLILTPAIARVVYAGCETVLATDSTKVNKTGDTMTGSLIMNNVPVSLTGSSGYVLSQSSITSQGFFGPITGAVTGNVTGNVTGAVTGNATTATALQSAPSTAGSGFLSRGIDVNGNAQTAVVDASAVSASTNPVQSGGMFTALAAKAADSAVVHIVGSENVTGAKTFTATGNTQYSLATSSGISNGGPLVNAGTIRAQNSGANTFSIVTSSGINVVNGAVTAPYFSGDGSHLTGLSGSISGGVQSVVPVFNDATSFGGPGQGFITSVSTGVAISTNVTLGVSGSTTTSQGFFDVLGTSNLCADGGVLVSSADVVSVTTTTLPIVYVASTTYKLHMNVSSTNNTHFFAMFNSDYRAKYANANAWQENAGGIAAASGETLGGFGALIGYDGACAAEGVTFKNLVGSLNFETVYGSTLTYSSDGFFRNFDGTNQSKYWTSSTYVGDVPMTNISIVAATDCSTSKVATFKTYSGHLEICAEGYQHK